MLLLQVLQGMLLSDPNISAPGLLDQYDDCDLIIDNFADAIEQLPRTVRLNDEELIDKSKSILRRILGRKLGKKPLIEVHVIRL